MKVGVVACADSNLYASTTVARLVQQGNVPACIILAEEPAWRRLVSHVRVAGLWPTLRKLARHFNVGGLPDRDARHYLSEYARSRALHDWDASLSHLASRHGIEMVRVASVHDEQAVRTVRERGVDLLINAAGVIYKAPLLTSAKLGMLNAHMAELPRFRGMNVLEWSLWFGVRPAITVHFVTPGIDLGEILAVREIPVASDDTVASLRAASYPVMIETMAESIAALREGRAVRQPQSPQDGKQYFVMHPRLLQIVEGWLAKSRS